MSSRIINGDSAKELKKFKDNSIDAVICDPPYGIEFLAKDWDSNTGAITIWKECLRVLKPGGFLLAFSAARTYHILATNIESVGFEIRDQIMWLYTSGFPKAQDVGKNIQRRQGVEKTKKLKKGKIATRNSYQGETGFSSTNQKTIIPTSPEAQKWSGWKTGLKPAHEPICMARKPMKGSTIDNVLEHGVGALNIDESRIPFESAYDEKHQQDIIDGQENATKGTNFFGTRRSIPSSKSKKRDFEIYVNNMKGPLERSTAKEGDNIGIHEGKTGFKVQKGKVGEDFIPNTQGRFPSNVLGEIEGYQKFFYCPKVSRKERHRGFEQNNIPTDNPTNNGNYIGTTTHPTDPKLKDSLSHIISHFPRSELSDDGPKILRRMVKVNKKDPLSHIKEFARPKSNIPSTGVQVLRRMEQKVTDPKLETHNINVMGKTLMCLDCGLTFKGFLGNDHSKCDPKKASFVEKRQPTMVGNNHPTVKPVTLMKYLIKLVAPKGAHIVDPFCGSGSTGMAAKELGYKFTGIEMDKSYCKIAKKRISGCKADQFEKLFN